MANVKITDLTEDTNPADGDWIETVDISAGSSKKVTRTNFFKTPPHGANSIPASALQAGQVAQIVSTGSTAVATGTTTIPLDDTIPQNTEGIEFLTQAITPKSATNKLVIEVTLFLANSAAVTLIAALFQDSTANALAASAVNNQTINTVRMVKLVHTMTAGTTSATTFKARAGGSAAGTTTFNGASAARLFGAINKSMIKITEYVV